MIHDNSSQQETGRLLIGAYGWQQPPMIEQFYPEDMPEEWRLSFYANEFPAVLVPFDEWSVVEDELEEWLDVPEGFRFFLEAGEAGYGQRQDKVIQQLGEYFAGLVTELEGLDEATGVAVIDPRSRSLRGWKDWLEQHGPSLRAVFLKNETLRYSELRDLSSLLELMNF